MARRYFTLDVFTDTPLGGNPLAVVLDSEGLNDQHMQAIAGEFNLSETVFVGPGVDDANRAALRIFTPKNELPFAGHPTVGTAILLASLDGIAADQKSEFVLEEKVGPVSCTVWGGSNLPAAKFSLPKLPTRQVANFDLNLLAEGLGLSPDQLTLEGHQHSICNAGVAFPMVALADLRAMASINIKQSALEKCFTNFDVAAELYVYTKQCMRQESHYHARMFAPAMGIAEDPATGSAVASFAAQILSCDKPADGNHTLIIEQGMEMGRPSRIELGMEISESRLVSANIGGSAVIISEGKLRI